MSLEFTEEELKAIREEICAGASDSQFNLFISEAKARNLRPGTHLFFQLRSVNEWDPEVGAKVRKSKATWITKIDAFRLISQRTGKDAGRGKTRWVYLDDNKMPTIESTIPLPDKANPQLPREPYACIVPIYRSDYKEPVEVVCRFEAYAVTMKSANGPVLTEMWQRRGPEQLEKCTEAATRRATYPEELGSIFLAEEFKPETEENLVTPSALTSVPVPQTAPEVNQTPATPTNEARPGETKRKTSEEAIKKISEEGKQINQKAIDESKDKVLKSVPSLKTASELPEPKKSKKKQELSPTESGVTDDDFDLVGSPALEIDAEKNKQEATNFVDSVVNFTAEEAKEAGLPEPPEYSLIPNKEQQSGFTAKVRDLAKSGANMLDLKNYILGVGKKTSSKLLTVGDWKKALDQLETAQKEGKLVETVKNAPLPKF
jgi:hypothetical protein